MCRLWTFAALAVLSPSPGCGSRSRHPHETNGGVVDAGLSPDGGPEGTEDVDDDGIPDELDPNPEEPDEPSVQEDFSVCPDWIVDGVGDWSCTEEGQVAQGRPCAAGAASPTVFGPADSFSNVLVHAHVRLPEDSESCDVNGAGLFARRAGGSFVACLLVPGPEGGIELALLRFRGESLGMSSGEVLESIPTSQPTNFETGWVRLFLMATGNDLRCGGAAWMDVAGDVAESEFHVDGLDDAPAAGGTGLITWDSSGSMDDFQIFDLSS